MFNHHGLRHELREMDMNMVESVGICFIHDNVVC